MANEAIGRPLGGLYGLLAGIGIDVTSGGNNPTDAVVDFTGDTQITGKQPLKCHTGELADSDDAGGVFSFQNPESSPIIILGLLIEVTTVATGACTLDAGVAADGNTSDDTLIDGQDVNSAAGVFGNTGYARLDANGGTTDWLTVSMATGATADLVGNAHVLYATID